MFAPSMTTPNRIISCDHNKIAMFNYEWIFHISVLHKDVFNWSRRWQRFWRSSLYFKWQRRLIAAVTIKLSNPVVSTKITVGFSIFWCSRKLQFRDKCDSILEAQAARSVVWSSIWNINLKLKNLIRQNKTQLYMKLMDYVFPFPD